MLSSLFICRDFFSFCIITSNTCIICIFFLLLYISMRGSPFFFLFTLLPGSVSLSLHLPGSPETYFWFQVIFQTEQDPYDPVALWFRNSQILRNEVIFPSNWTLCLDTRPSCRAQEPAAQITSIAYMLWTFVCST